jgi:sarcosine oxidase
MSATRRDLTKKAGAQGVTGAPSLPRATRPHSAKHYDVCVIGAGVFGSWTALELARRGLRVALVDAYGPANSRASSGGESRIIRMGYGPDEIYTRWAMRSLDLWTLFCERVGQPLFHATGVLWLASAQDPFTG